MKYLPILFVCLAAVACHEQSNSGGAAASTADSVLYSDIIRPVTDSLQQFPNNHELYYRRAMLLFNTHPALAEPDFEKGASLMPANTDYWAGAGEAALVSEHFKKAEQMFAQALGTAPGNAYLRYRLATAMIENKEYATADSVASVLAQTADARDKAFYLKARIAEDHKDTVTAIQHLTSAIHAAGATPEYEALMELGDLLHSRKAPQAISYYVQAWQLDSTNAEPMFSIGVFQQELGNKPAAIAAFKKAVVADPGYEAAYLAMGHLYLDDQNWKEALTWYNLAAKSAPTDAWAYYYRALCHEKSGNKISAVEDYSKASSFKKDFTEAKEALKRLNK
ncbi:tetratricopeptide repeat protein [Chitinophaga vietnamensis]|uniref:tetratricopeptide repeat protein n=1 Tax=Chitinophaga vietnamensis TaxID=2593957 RepID=UPI00117809AE|nr:tetratricopeptide repeat protein [Chitinophaga vietnamensis]